MTLITEGHFLGGCASLNNSIKKTFPPQSCELGVFRKDLEGKTSREIFLGWQYLLAEAVMIMVEKNKKQGRYSLVENEVSALQNNSFCPGAAGVTFPNTKENIFYADRAFV